MINKVASDNPKSWHKLVGFVLWAIRETPNETTGVPPALLAWGRVPRGPLAILKDTMTGKVDLPLNLGKTASEYTDSQGQRPVPAPRPAPRRCYLCNSPTHLASDCPQKSSYRGYPGHR